jgi:replicative DNA helicase
VKRTNDNHISSAEYQILKLMVLNPDLDIKNLTSSNLPHKKSRILMSAIQHLQDNSEAVNELSLFRVCNQKDPEFDLGIVRNLLSVEVEDSNFDNAYELLRKSAIRSKAGRILHNLLDHVESQDDLNLESISSALYNAQETLSTSGGKKVMSKTLLECIDEYELDLLQRQLGKYYPFFDPFLDGHLLKKGAPGQVILAAGSTGTGKSVYALNIINGLVNNNVPCMYFSLEMDRESTMDRWLANRLGIPVTEFYKTGREMDPTISLVRKERESVSDRSFRFIDDPSISLATIVRLIREFKMTYKTDYAMIFIDLVTQVKEFVAVGKGNLSTSMELAVNKLNAIAKKENVCFFCVAQMNREADSTRITSIDELHKLRPTINNIKNSHALGERSRSVLALFRPKYYAERLFPEDETLEFMPDHLEVQIVKQSMGKTGTVGQYLFNGSEFRLTPVEGSIEEEMD